MALMIPLHWSAQGYISQLWSMETYRDALRVYIFFLHFALTNREFSTLLESLEGKSCIEASAGSFAFARHWLALICSLGKRLK
jgi:hypothetical protein